MASSQKGVRVTTRHHYATLINYIENRMTTGPVLLSAAGGLSSTFHWSRRGGRPPYRSRGDALAAPRLSSGVRPINCSMTDSHLPRSDRKAVVEPTPDPHPVRTRVERVLGSAIGLAVGIALGWLLAEGMHFPMTPLVLGFSGLGLWLGYRFSREVLELAMWR